MVDHKGIKLTVEDRDKILRGEWLNDNIITAFNVCLNFPTITGLQDTIIGETQQFETQNEEFVKVLHIGGNHWGTMSTVDGLIGK